MSASLVIDLGLTTLMQPSITPDAGVASTPASGEIVGGGVNIQTANVMTNLVVTAGLSSGTFRVQVQTASGDTSGWYTDPTSGLAVMPSAFLSGGILLCNSGQSSGYFSSGLIQAAAFLSPGIFVRARVLSGDSYTGPVACAFVKQLKETGSGGGFTWSPAAPGVVNV